MGWPGEKLLIKLWETLAEKGIGALLKPRQIRREGAAQTEVRAKEIVMLAQAEKYADEIRAGRMSLDASGVLQALPAASDATVLPPEKAPLLYKTIQAAATETIVADTIRKEINVARAIIQAEQQLAGDGCEPAQQNINDDWLFRWRDYAGAVSEEQLQNVWGKV
jgi:hypothetical protein